MMRKPPVPLRDRGFLFLSFGQVPRMDSDFDHSGGGMDDVFCCFEFAAVFLQSGLNPFCLFMIYTRIPLDIKAFSDGIPLQKSILFCISRTGPILDPYTQYIGGCHRKISPFAENFESPKNAKSVTKKYTFLYFPHNA